MYQCFIRTGENRYGAMTGPLSFPSAEERLEFVRNDPRVYWYHFAEEDDWFDWRRGGAWATTHEPGKADVVPEPPEITEEDRL
jgi:hypothetical protein